MKLIKLALAGALAGALVACGGSDSDSGSSGDTNTMTSTQGVIAGKAMFANLRSNLNAFSNAQKTGGLNVRSDALQKDLQVAIAPLDNDLANWIVLANNGMVLYADFMASRSGNTTSVPGLGICGVASDMAGDILATAPANATSVACHLERTQVPGSEVPDLTKQRTYTSQQFTKSILLLPINKSTQNFTYNSRARMETAHYNKDGLGNKINITRDAKRTTIGTYGPTDRASGTISFGFSGSSVNSTEIHGFMPARTDGMGVAITDKEEWNLSYLRTVETGGDFKYALSGNLTSYKGGAPISSVTLRAGSLFRVELVNGEIFYEKVKEINLDLAIATSQSSVDGLLALSNFSNDKSGSSFIPTDLKFVGKLTNDSSEFFNGTLTVKLPNYAAYNGNATDTATNFLNTEASFVGIFKIAGRPDLTLTLTGASPAFNSTDYGVQYTDGTNTITIVGNESPGAQKLKISSADGISVQFVGTEDSADLMRNSNKIATFNRSTGIISYIDGSFESLK